MRPLIEALTDGVQPYLTMPFAFFGHSMGGLISFELARQLRRQQIATPVHLLVSAHRAPQLPDSDPPIHQLPDAEFMEELHRFNGTPRDVLENAELMHLFLPVLRADFAVCETYIYTPEEPLACPISVFGGLRDGKVSQSQLEAWREQTRGSFKLRMFAGDHFYLHALQESLLRAISQELAQHLD
jgi:medium-chain acyl-[acyl-carrier-protein] hydrolase